MTTLDLFLGATLDFDGEPTDTSLPLKVHGKSMNTGYIKSKHVIIPHTERNSIINTLKEGVDGLGAYILKDHGYKSFLSSKSVDLLIGRINDSSALGKSNILYSGRIEDADMAFKIRKKLVTTSSIGLHMGKMNCSICGREYGDPNCMHLLGKEYPDEGLHDIAKDYLEEMEGKSYAAIVGTGIRALEQSIVLFPAIAGANVQADNSLQEIVFADVVENFIKETEDKKIGFERVSLTMNYEEIVSELREIIEGFNKENIEDNNRNAMSGNEFDFDKIMDELVTLKADKKLLDATVETLKAEKKVLESDVSRLTSELAGEKSKITTLQELVDAYKEDEKQRVAKERSELTKALTDMRKEKGLAEKDYASMELKELKHEYAILSEFKAQGSPQGSVAGDNSIPAKDLELKENIREMIFRKRKDGKALKGIQKLEDLRK